MLDIWCDKVNKSQEIILFLPLTVYCFDGSAMLDGVLNFTDVQVVDFSWLDEDIIDQDSDTSCRNLKSYFTFADKQNQDDLVEFHEVLVKKRKNSYFWKIYKL